MAFSERAADLIDAYGQYPIARTFAVTDSASDLMDSDAQAYSAAFDVDASTKRHAACDECRKRKLKCSGEPAGCDRCIKQNLICHYSAQKQMGRPRKRQRTSQSPPDEEIPGAHPSSNEPAGDRQRRPRPPPPTVHTAAPAAVLDPDLPQEADIDRTNFQNICNAPITQSIKRVSNDARAAAQKSYSQSTSSSQQLGSMTSHGSNSTSPYDAPRTPPEGSDAMAANAYPTDVSQWPDFSDMTVLPMLVQYSHEPEKFAGDHATASVSAATVTTGADSTTARSSTPFTNYSSELNSNPSNLTQLPAIPACPCLPNLYLTLSTLSSLSAFPVSSGTIDTLISAHRTGRSVLYCPVCPTQMQSGSQNVMLSSVLITVLSDHWHRVKKATAKELRAGFSTSDGPTDVDQPMTVREDLEWRTFGYKLLRAYVFGDSAIPDPPGSLAPRKTRTQPTNASSDPEETSIYTLSSLVGGLERRQKQWHEVAPFGQSQEFPPRLEHVGLHSDSHAQGQGLPRGYTTGMTLEDIKAAEEECHANGDDGLLCLKIVKHSRTMMRTLDSAVPRVEA